MPTLYLLIILATRHHAELWWLLGLMLLFRWMTLVGVVLGRVPARAHFDYVRRRPRASACRDAAIMWRHFCPTP